MADAFYNGFPIVYSDTATYLSSGFELETPVDRPITYGLFIRAASLNGLSLWAVIFFQSLLLSYLIFLFIKLISEDRPFFLPGIMIILFLSLFTGISWTSSQLIADIFTPIAFLSLAIILFFNIKLKTGIFLFLIYFIAVSMHMSHILLFSSLLVIIYLAKKILFKKEDHKRVRLHIGILFALTLSSILTMGSAISKSKDVFMMGAMIEQGITQQYLNEYCGTRNYKLCAYKDSLPNTLGAFVWHTDSPFYKTGGWSAENRKELNDIIFATLTEPKYIKLHIEASLKATGRQLTGFNIFDGNVAYPAGTPLFERISKYVPNDVKCYKDAKQNQGGFPIVGNANTLYDIILVISTLCILLVLFLKNKKLEGYRSIAIVFLLAILLNAWDAATFSCVSSRFGCKMMWLIPFFLGIVAIRFYTDSQQRKLLAK